MDPAKIFTKIKEMGHVNARCEELREYCKIKMDMILKCLPKRILSGDGADLLDCLLKGIPDQTPALQSKVKIVDIVLEVMRKESTSLTHCGDVISRLCLEIPRMSADDLVRWCNDTVQSIVDDSDVNMIWKDILPECNSALSTHSQIKHCGTNMTSAEYKEQCVRTLCQCRWTERQLVQLTAMFKDMHLNQNDHKQVVNKICSYVIDVPPETLPPLFHQLLKLCKTHNVEIVLAHFAHYFNVRLYGKLDPPQNDSDSTTVDIDDIVTYSEGDLSRCLSTCIYHISQGAADPEVIRKHLKLWPKTQLLKSPFIMDLALALSDKGSDFRTVCLDVIKQAIEQRLQDETRSKESAWVRSVLPPDVDVTSVLKVLTTESVVHWQLTTLGLLKLGIALVGSKKGGAARWSLGELILVRLTKSQPDISPRVLEMLADCLQGDVAPQIQYANCLYVLCKLTPMSIQRCPQLSSIVESCTAVGADYRPAAAVLDAMHPLLNLSTRLRDTLIMVCRKRLYSRDSLNRCLALSGFLTILRHMKLPRGVASSSQSLCSEQFSAHSYLTQLTVDLHATNQGAPVTSRVRNEAMLMEVVSIMRRCLLQDAAVKQLLYSKIFDCSKEKPVLHEPILEMLYEHLTKYISEEENGVPIMFEKCVQTHAITAILTEPIAHLLYAIAQFLQPEEEDLEDILGSQTETGSAYLRSKLNNMLGELCKSERLGCGDVEDLGLSDLTPESKAKSLTVQQMLQCHEALIAHQIMQWNIEGTNVATTVYNLYKGYSELLDKTKAPPKLGKKSSKSTLNDTKETNKSQKSQKSQKEKSKTPAKLSNLVKDRAGPFKPLPCCWSLKFCLRIMELLYSEEVPWASLEQRNLIRARRDFHLFALRCIQSVLSSECLEKRPVAHYVAKIAELVYRRCLCRFQDMYDFDDQTALLCVDLFRDCLDVLMMPQYGFKIDKFLPSIIGETESTASNSLATILERVHNALEQANADEEAVDKRSVTSLTQLCSQLLEVNVHCDTRLSGVIIQLEDFVRRCKIDCVQLMPALLNANCRAQQDAPFLDDLLLKLTNALGRIDEEDTSAGQDADSEHFPTIDERTGQTALNIVCAHLLTRFKHTEHLVGRAKDLQVALKCCTQAGGVRIDKELRELSNSLITQLCQLTLWSGKVAQTRSGGDRALTVCVRLYSLLCAALKHVMVQACRAERLIKLAGKKLSSITDNLITYVEASQTNASGARVLRDTRQIPRLVLEAEQFNRLCIVIDNKLKLNWHQYLSLGTARDFRIKAPILQEMLKEREQEETRDNEDVDINDAETTVLSENSDNEEDNPSNKRRRVS